MVKLASVVLFATLAIGCDRDDRITSDREESGSTTNLEDVSFAVVNGWPLTAAYVRDTILIMDRLDELKHHRGKRKTYSALELNNLAMKMTPMLLSSRLLEEEMNRLGIVADPSDVKAMLAKYNRLSGQKTAGIDELASKFDDLEGLFRKQFERESRMATFMRTAAKIEVSDQDVARRLIVTTNAWKRAERINTEARRKGEQAWSELKGGVSWADVAKKYNEDALADADNANYWREWLTIRPQDIGLSEVREALPALKEGEFSRPLDTDEGLLIVKVLKIEDGIYTCVRILIRLAYLVEIPTIDEARAEIRKEKAKARRLELVEGLKNKAKIEYPLGTNFYYRIWALPKEVEKKLKQTPRPQRQQ